MKGNCLMLQLFCLASAFIALHCLWFWLLGSVNIALVSSSEISYKQTSVETCSMLISSKSRCWLYRLKTCIAFIPLWADGFVITVNLIFLKMVLCSSHCYYVLFALWKNITVKSAIFLSLLTEFACMWQSWTKTTLNEATKNPGGVYFGFVIFLSGWWLHDSSTIQSIH